VEVAVRRRWWRLSSMQRDAALTVLLTGLLLYGTIGEAYPSDPANQPADGGTVPHPPVLVYGLVVIAGLVLLGRRRWPMQTFVISLSAVLVFTGLGYVNGAIVVAAMVGLYTVTSTVRPRQAVLIAVVTAVLICGLTALRGPFGPLGGPVTVYPFLVAAVLGLGVAVANRRAYVAAVEERAERAERTREEEARRRVDAERLRIARELHDVVAHTISMINVQSRVAAQVIADPPPQGAQALASIKEYSAEALRELRGILGLLRQDDDEPTSPAPGLDQLDVLVASTNGAGLPTTVATVGEPRRLPPTTDLAAYRIVQESLTNSLRHAGPANAAVSIRYADDGLVVQVDDTGRGMPRANGTGAGHGIVGMRERVAAIGGRLDAGPRPGGGFRVTARLPVS